MKHQTLKNSRLNRRQLPFTPSMLALFCAAAFPVSAGIVTEAESQIERISITASPLRDSQEESIMLQREAKNVVNVIASDDIGRFPDQTAAAALARLPAVAVQRDQGQERYIQVRGAPARWTSVAFDGINVLGAEERIFRFDSVPAAVMNAVEVSKTLTPDMSAEALAGRVDIKTYSPLNNPGLHADFDLGLGRMALGDGDQERYAARVSWADETFGVMAAVSSFVMEQVTDNNETRWTANGLPERFDFRSYQLERETNSAMLKLEYAPTTNHKIAFTSLYTEFTDHELRNQYQLNLGRGTGERGETQGELVAVPLQAWYQDGNYENNTFVNTLAGKHQLRDWRLDWAINYTETESSTDLPIILRNKADATEQISLKYDLSDPEVPYLQLFQTNRNSNGALEKGAATNSLNLNGFVSDMMLNYGGMSETESVALKLDLSRNWQHAGADTELKFGFQYDDRDASSPGSSNGSIAISSLASQVGASWTPDAFVTDSLWSSDFNYGFQVPLYNNPALRAQVDNVMAALTAAGLVDPDSFYPADTRYTVTEKVLSGYLMNSWTWSQHQLLLGVRLEKTDLQSDGYLNEAEGSRQISTSSDKTRIYPSLHWNMELTDDIKIRSALVTGTSRPNFSQQRAGASISDANQSISGGNPFVKPETAVGYDGSVEWYFADAALLAMNVFYRDIDDVLFDSKTTVTDNRFDSIGFNRVGYDYTTTMNGSDGKLTGIELSYMQPWDFLPEKLHGFGMQFNISFLDSEFVTPDGRKTALPGTSDQILNTTLFYENYGWSVRLSWQWRDKWLDDISADSSSDVYWDESARLDLSVRYQLNDYLTVYFDANNLTEETGVRYEGSKERPIEVEGYGRRFLLGIKATF